MHEAKHLRKVAWGLTGSGDKLAETISIMKEIKDKYESRVDISPYLSKAAQQVLGWYKLGEEFKKLFPRSQVEINANSPFLAGDLQTRRFEFLLIAPASSNTVAKISVGIADSLLSNSAIMSMKALVPVYVMPTDSRAGTVSTELPNGTRLNLQVRKEDAENVRKLERMAGISLIEKPEEIRRVFDEHFSK